MPLLFLESSNRGLRSKHIFLTYFKYLFRHLFVRIFAGHESSGRDDLVLTLRTLDSITVFLALETVDILRKTLRAFPIIILRPS